YTTLIHTLSLHDALPISQYPNSNKKFETAVRNDSLPQSWPAFDAIKQDDKSRLWVSAFTSDPQQYQWWVLDTANGELLARFTWPQAKQIEEIKGGKVYTRETNEETGLQEVMRYNISTDK